LLLISIKVGTKADFCKNNANVFFVKTLEVNAFKNPQNQFHSKNNTSNSLALLGYLSQWHFTSEDFQKLNIRVNIYESPI